MSIIKNIHKSIIEYLEARDSACTTSEVRHYLYSLYPDYNKNTISTQLSEIHLNEPERVSKPGRGLLLATRNEGDEPVIPDVTSKPALCESDLYESFADFLTNDLEEAKVAVELGGGALRSKWGTPDVVGVFKPERTDIVQFPEEIVSAEIKLDSSQSVVAFGQAVAYKLFSHKVYIVMPETMAPEDLSRLDSLALLHGVGLVLFRQTDSGPEYILRLKAPRSQPDMFYVNEFAHGLNKSYRKQFRSLFG